MNVFSFCKTNKGVIMAYHTFEFLRKRRHEPKWKLDYQIALLSRILYSLIIANVFVWGYGLFIHGF